MPTLLMNGGNSYPFMLETAKTLNKAIPGAKLKVIANAGHVSNMERPEEFSALVRRFARSN